MLGNALFYVALIAIVFTTFLSAGLAMTRMTIHQLAQTYVTAGYQRAATVLQQTLANEMKTGGLPNPLPALTPLPAACVGSSSPCKFQSSATMTFTQTSTPAPAASCDALQTNCASNQQANAYVNEGRVTARILVTVSAADGTVLVERAGDVVLRTMSTPPYAVLDGSRDASFDDVALGAAAGDLGGTLPATPDPCTANGSGTADDTVVRVAYRNQTTNACSDGSSWQTSSFSTSSNDSAGWTP